jgi:selenocysteine lyase/cysteine desulfurase
MYVSPDFLDMLAPQCHFFNTGRPWSRLDAAGPDHAGIAALAGIGDYFQMLYDHHFETSDLPLSKKASKISSLMHRHETSLCQALLERLAELPVRVLGKMTVIGREANVALISENQPSARLSTLIGKEGIATKHGHFYAYRILKKMGLTPEDGVLRLSFAHYNNMDETVRLIHALTGILGKG